MFGRKKMYKKGLADAMQAYEDFGRKQEEALAQIREEVKAGKKLEDALAELGDNINGIYDHLNGKEKAALYHLSTPMDIKALDEQERQLLMAVLYQLADDEGSAVTEEQRAYIRAVQRYLEITNPETQADLEVVGEIDSLEVQKAFYQVTMEFFYLADEDELTDQQGEFLKNFSLNDKQVKLIDLRVSRLYNAMGAKGLAEKYGYHPEGEPDTGASKEQLESFEKRIQRITSECKGYNMTVVGCCYSRGKSAYLESEQYKDRSRCERDAEKELRKFYDEVVKQMNGTFERSKEKSCYGCFKSALIVVLDQAMKEAKELSGQRSASIVEKIISLLSPTKVLEEMKNKNDALARKYALDGFSYYTGSINYEVNDPSEFETGFFKGIAKCFKTYGYSVDGAGGEIRDAAVENLDSFAEEFNSEAEDCIRKNIVDPVQELLPQLRAALGSQDN